MKAGFSALIALSISLLPTLATAQGADPVKESQAAALRIKEAQAKLAVYKARAAVAEADQKIRFQRQLEADRVAELEVQRINEETKKYQKDIAIAEFNARRSEIALAYAQAKTKRQKQYQQKVYQRKIASERDASKRRN